MSAAKMDGEYLLDSQENYVYKAEVNWSMLVEGFTLPVREQVIFARNMGHFLQRGESKDITVHLQGKGYKAQIRNVNFDPRFKRAKDTLQIRYPKNGELAKMLQTCFSTSFQYMREQRELRTPGERIFAKLPEENKEHVAIYTTQYEDTYIFEVITRDDLLCLKQAIQGHTERAMESDFNFDTKDKSTMILDQERIIKIRKLNRKIGDNLKLLYEYQCQICGQRIGERYGAYAIEAHHIHYFVSSLNNDAGNQLIVCPNHHSIIHETDPVFDKRKLIFIYPNGLREGLVLNKHLIPT